MIYTVSKKFLLIPLILFGLTLTGCTQKMDQDDLFEKKQECNNYINDVKEEILKRNNNDLGLGGKYGLEEIFYSPIKQEYYIIINLGPIDNDPKQTQFKYLYKYGNHFADSESIDSCLYENGSISTGCELFRKKIKELKGE